jgi:hypothetical protein
MISLHSSHTELDMLMVAWDATELSLDCQIISLRAGVSDMLFITPRVRASQQ